jgi:hypothetical protein
MALNNLKNHTKTWNQPETINILKFVSGFLDNFKMKKHFKITLPLKKNCWHQDQLF